MQLGRPPFEFDQAIADEICERLSKGESLRTICGGERDDFVPGQSTVYKWLRDVPDFAKQYAYAREDQADSMFDEAREIAQAATAETVQVARLQVDTIKWQAGKLRPKVYGDKQTVEHTDPNGNNPFASLMEAVSANGRPRPSS